MEGLYLALGMLWYCSASVGVRLESKNLRPRAIILQCCG
jgi:hypothetical protein